jgi:uncharacterized protein YdaU (DUF1376 family)
MGKNPAFQFYPADYVRDTTKLPLFVRGAYMHILCALWFAEPRGTMTLSRTEWSRVVGCTEEEIEKAFHWLVYHNIMSISLDNAGSVQVISRRMSRDEKAREYWKKSKREQRVHVLSKKSPAVSSNLQSSDLQSNIVISNEITQIDSYRSIMADFEELWKAHPGKGSKKKARDVYHRRRMAKSIPPLKFLLEKIEIQKSWRRWKEGIIPHLTTWINQDRWDEEPPEHEPLEQEDNSQVLQKWLQKSTEAQNG